MNLDKSAQYTYRIGSDNQHRLFWKGNLWCYEFLAGGVIFDEQSYSNESDLLEGLSLHGLTLNDFIIDADGKGTAYSEAIQQKLSRLKALGITPCAKHGLSSKNDDGSCEACVHTDFPDDFKGTEG